MAAENGRFIDGVRASDRIEAPRGASLDAPQDSGLPVVPRNKTGLGIVFERDTQKDQRAPITDLKAVAEYFRTASIPRPKIFSKPEELFADSPEETEVVDLPEKYTRIMTPHKKVVADDLDFFEDLTQRYKEAKAGHEGESQEERTERYFQVIREVHDQILDIRSESENGIVAAPDVSHLPVYEQEHVLRAYAATDKNRVSSRRSHVLSMLTLHHPLFKRDHTLLQRDKIEGAFPGFAADMETLDVDGIDLDTYFQKTLDVMSTNLIKATAQYDPQDMASLGIVMGFHQNGFLKDDQSARNDLARVGSKTFTNVLQNMTAESIREGTPVEEMTRREFLEKDGMGHMLMKMHIAPFMGIVDEMTIFGVTNFRDQVAAMNGPSGICPAGLAMDSVEDPGQTRPVAFEYATVIGKHIPESARI